MEPLPLPRHLERTISIQQQDYLHLLGGALYRLDLLIKNSHPNEDLVTARKLAALDTVLGRFLAPVEVERFVAEWREHTQIHGHTGLADDLPKSARIISRLWPSDLAAALSWI